MQRRHRGDRVHQSLAELERRADHVQADLVEALGGQPQHRRAIEVALQGGQPGRCRRQQHVGRQAGDRQRDHHRHPQPELRAVTDPRHHGRDRHDEVVRAVDEADQQREPRDGRAIHRTGVELGLQPLGGCRADPEQAGEPLVEVDRRVDLEREAEVVVHASRRVVASVHLLVGVGRGEAAAVVVDEQHERERQPVEQHPSPRAPALAEQADAQEAGRERSETEAVGGDAEPGDEDREAEDEGGVGPAPTALPHRVVLLHPPDTSLGG